jgi:cell fate regulator YaaT (PSP1 superfamily)
LGEESERLATIVGVRFERAGPVEYFDPADVDLSVDDRVVVETDEGPREGHVVIAPEQVLYSELRGPLDRVLHRVALEEG